MYHNFQISKIFHFLAKNHNFWNNRDKVSELIAFQDDYDINMLSINQVFNLWNLSNTITVIFLDKSGPKKRVTI